MKAACVGVADAGSIFGKSTVRRAWTSSTAPSGVLASHYCTLVIKSCLRVVLPKQKRSQKSCPFLYNSGKARPRRQASLRSKKRPYGRTGWARTPTKAAIDGCKLCSAWAVRAETLQVNCKPANMQKQALRNPIRSQSKNAALPVSIRSATETHNWPVIL